MSTIDDRHANATVANRKTSSNKPQKIEDDDIEAPSLGISQELVESRATVLRPTYTAINELHGRPAPSLDIAPELL